MITGSLVKSLTRVFRRTVRAILRNHIRKRLTPFSIFGVVLILSAIQAYTAKNYPEQNFPYYAGNYALENPKPVEVLTVLSYNIWFAEEIDQAIADIKEIKSQKELDIILLQEMDEAGTEQIARELQLNYIYFPAAIEPTYNKKFGNAILTRWPIIESKKLILPHKSLSNHMNRIATRATVRIQGADILVYSIHTESVFTLPRFREDQITTVLDDVRSDDRMVIIGGDFNSFTQADVERIEVDFRQAGFIRASKESGHTIVKFGIEGSTDHIFSKGFFVEETGKMTGATASDHLPIWVTLRCWSFEKEVR